MREFLLLSRTTTDRIELNNLSFGRWDVLARCINSALWIAHALRPAKMHIVLGASSPPKIVTFDPAIKKVNPDEKNIAAWIAKVIEGKSRNPGISVAEGSFQTAVRGFAESGRKLFILHEKGKDIQDVELPEDPLFVLGDHIGLPEKDEAFAKRFPHELVSIGPRSYLASQCISYINIELDRRGIA
jgi:tRNA (pseudouridine54-N1)-methyltransferase